MIPRSELRITADDVLAGRGRGHEGPESLWRTLVDLGWPLVGIREDVGGAGGSIDDLLDLATAIGYATAAVPFAGAALGAWVGAESGRPELTVDPPVVGPLHGADVVEVDGGRAAGHLRGLPTTGADQTLVFHTGADDQPAAMLRLGGPGVHLTRRRTLAGEDRLDVRLNDAPVEMLPSAPARPFVRQRATLLTLALTTGALDRALELTVSHVRVREQFGRPLARLAMVRAQVASMTVAATAAHSAMRAARTGSATEAWAAAVVVRRAADEVATTAHQLHGALGTTLEHDLHHATSRIWSWRDDATTASQAAERLGDTVLTEHASMWGLCAG